MPNLSVATFNCKYFDGFMKEKVCRDLLDKCDFLLLQEHWLFLDNFHKFDKISDRYTVCKHGKSSMDPSVLRVGRPYGGCVILWKDNINLDINLVNTTSSRLNCVQITSRLGFSFLLFNVYMPTDDRTSGGNLCEYQDVLAEISTISNNINSSFIMIAGDFNTDFARNTPQSRELINFCESESLVSCSNLTCSNIDFTYECSATGNRSLIDHILITENVKDFICNFQSYETLDNSSDHIPLTLDLNINCEYLETKERIYKPKIAWYKVNVHDDKQYKSYLDKELKNIALPQEAFECNLLNCEAHCTKLNEFSKSIVDSCLTAGHRSLPTIGNETETSYKKNVKAGWNDFCRDKKEIALYWHHRWKNDGKPSNSLSATMRRKTRMQYHYSVRCIEKNKDIIKADKMASKKSSNRNGLWKEAKKMRGKNNKLPIIVDNTSGEDNISELFGKKFHGIFNSVAFDHKELDTIKDEVNCKIRERNLLVDNSDGNNCTQGKSYQTPTSDVSNKLDTHIISPEDIKEALRSLKVGKSDGNLGLYSDHFIRGTNLLYTYISFLFNAMLKHGYTPDSMCIGTIIPIIKNKRKSTNDSDNFRGICLQSSLCKLLDIIILDKESEKLKTSEIQIGFKENMSTDIAAAIVKDTIDYYKSRGGTVYCVSLDASKAFDRVDFCKLFRLLLERNVNPVIIRLLINMYTNQKNRVQYNQSHSEVFDIANGVKQGGVLSPTLFCIYIDNLLETLKESGYGCNIGDAYVGCIAYADDILLLSGSLYGLKEQIKICESFASEYKIIFNGSKSKLIIFSQDDSTQFPEVAVCGEVVEKVNELSYLGYLFSCDQSDSFQTSLVKDFNCKFNIFMSDFNKVTSKLKHDLFNIYCCNFYGSNICKFQNLQSIDIQWRKAVRRIWRLPYRARSVLLPFISNSLPPSISFLKRFVKFYLKNIQSNNTIVNFVFNSALSNDTRLGNNIRYVLYKYDLSLRDIENGELNFETIWYSILNEWKTEIKDEHEKLGKHILELVMRRDCLEPWILSKKEIQEVIDMISTE